MSNLDAILGLKRELKTVRKKVSDLKAQNISWRSVSETLRDLLALDEAKYSALLKSRGITLE
ncbi:hypothetical protein [Bradyrhizobium sp. 195]|uniref:hypothetical protein n=1 Tax=Bradyrhizobium sp. 195 TaxID=2782662 RepID=UPI002001A6E7|nr:hypothetical protein [Bradyrhizobium sp. 195]UPK28389.1 hypothetical protein IVB26_08220 [Bradyrhizobium sp. 195]